MLSAPTSKTIDKFLNQTIAMKSFFLNSKLNKWRNRLDKTESKLSYFPPPKTDNEENIELQLCSVRIHIFSSTNAKKIMEKELTCNANLRHDYTVWLRFAYEISNGK